MGFLSAYESQLVSGARDESGRRKMCSPSSRPARRGVAHRLAGLSRPVSSSPRHQSNYILNQSRRTNITFESSRAETDTSRALGLLLGRSRSEPPRCYWPITITITIIIIAMIIMIIMTTEDTKSSRALSWLRPRCVHIGKAKLLQSQQLV